MEAIGQGTAHEGVVPLQSINPIRHVAVAAQLIGSGGGASHHHPLAQVSITPHHPITEAEILDPLRWMVEIALHTQLI